MYAPVGRPLLLTEVGNKVGTDLVARPPAPIHVGPGCRGRTVPGTDFQRPPVRGTP